MGERAKAFEEYKEELKLQLYADEKVNEVFSANKLIKNSVFAEISSANCCVDYLSFPFCVLSSLCLTPCGASFCFFDHGKARIKIEMDRSCCVVTTRGIYILQQAMSNGEATGVKYWGLIPKVFKELTFGGITFVLWENLVFEKYVASGSCAKPSKHIVSVWSSEKPEEVFSIFCANSDQVIEFFRTKQ